MSVPYNTAVCYHPRHSRPATEDEKREDITRRVAALERAVENGWLSPQQVKEHDRLIATFAGYPRCTLPDERRE